MDTLLLERIRRKTKFNSLLLKLPKPWHKIPATKEQIPLFPGPRAYLPVIATFKKSYTHVDQRKIRPQHAENYMLNLCKDGMCSHAKKRLHAAALNYYYRHCLNQPLKLKVPYRPLPLPTCLGTNETQQIFAALPESHRFAFILMFAFGLKVGELLSLRIEALDVHSGILHLSKGRQLKLHSYLLPGLLKHLTQRKKQYHQDARTGRCYIRHQTGYVVDNYSSQPLFVSRKTSLIEEGKRGRSFINPATYHRILQQTMQKLKLTKICTCMVLRHSFAVNVLEKGQNILELQTILGHGDMRSTMNYLRCIQFPIESPLETLERPVKRERCALNRLADCIKSKAALRPLEVPIYLRNILAEAKDNKIEGLFHITDLKHWQQHIMRAFAKQQSYKVLCCSENQQHPHFNGLHPAHFSKPSDSPDYLFASYAELSLNNSPSTILLNLIIAMAIPNK